MARWAAGGPVIVEGIKQRRRCKSFHHCRIQRRKVASSELGRIVAVRTRPSLPIDMKIMAAGAVAVVFRRSINVAGRAPCINVNGPRKPARRQGHS